MNQTKNMQASMGKFDTHTIIKSIMQTGLKEDQAEAIVTAIYESRDYDLSKLATKDQLELVKQQVTNIEKNIATKEDMTKLEANMLKWFIATVIAMTGIIIAAIKFIH